MGVLRVRAGGTWVDVGGGSDPIWVDPSAPTDPSYELWYDTDANASLATSGGLDGSKPAAAPALAGMHYFATDTGRDWLCDGTGWIVMSEPDQPWVVTTTNVSFGGGGGSVNSTFHRSDGYCDALLIMGLGSSTSGSIGTGPTFTLPRASHANEVLNVIGQFSFYDATGPVFSLDPLLVTPTYFEPRFLATVGSGAPALGQIGATYPAAIGVNDSFFARLRYRMATRYL